MLPPSHAKLAVVPICNGTSSFKPDSCNFEYILLSRPLLLSLLAGGIAAPAIAAGVGAAIGLAGGTVAMASGVSGFLASTAGGAIVASTVGAAGGGVALKRVANRIGALYAPLL